MHGLESGARGRKTALLEKILPSASLVSVQMPCGRTVRQLIKHDPTLAATASLGAMFLVGTCLYAGGLSFVFVMLILLFLMREKLLALVARRMFRRCIEVQRKVVSSLDLTQKTLFVGSSFGGAVLVELLMQGLLPENARILLFAPAHELVCKYSQLSSSVRRIEKSSILIYHGTEDKVVSIEHSRRLAVALGAELIELEGENHQMDKSCRKYMQVWVEKIMKK